MRGCGAGKGVGIPGECVPGEADQGWYGGKEAAPVFLLERERCEGEQARCAWKHVREEAEEEQEGCQVR